MEMKKEYQGAISAQPAEADMEAINRKGYHPATVSDMEQCIGCASCAKICPDSIITVEKF